MDRLGARAGLQPGAPEHRGASQHRLSLCTGAGDADLDHGWAGKGAENGVLVRDAGALERLHDARAVVLDKTGTLTEGKPRVTAVVLAPGGPPEEDVLALIAAAERGSEHPLGEAIVRFVAEERPWISQPQTTSRPSPARGSTRRSGAVASWSGAPSRSAAQASGTSGAHPRDDAIASRNPAASTTRLATAS